MVKLTTFPERIALRESSFVLFAGRPYCAVPGDEIRDWIEVEGVRLGLTPSMTFSEFEGLDEALQSDELKELTKEYLKSTVEEEAEAVDVANKGQAHLAMITFIVEELIPRIYSGAISREGFENQVDAARASLAQRLDDELGVKTMDMALKSSAVKAIIKDAQLRERKNAPIIESQYSPSALGLASIPESLLGSAIGNQPLYVSNGRVFNLVKAQNKSLPMRLSLNNKIYGIGDEVLTLDALCDELHKREEGEWVSEALEELGTALNDIHGALSPKGKLYSHIFKLAKLKEYDFGNCGFIVKGSSYLLYVRTPKFVTQDARDGDTYWPYEPIQVAVQLSMADDTPISTGKAVIIGTVPTLPCVQERKERKPTHDICMVNRKESQYEQTVAGIIKKLGDAVSVITHPINREALEAHPGHVFFRDVLDDILTQRPMSREKAERDGYVVYDVLPRRE